MLYINNKIIKRSGKYLKATASPGPPDPETGQGYWVNKDTGAETAIYTSDSYISNDPIYPGENRLVLNRPSWLSQASEIYVPEGVFSISNGALSSAPDLKLVSMPSSVKRVHAGALDGSINLNKLYIYSQSEDFIFQENAFGDSSLQIKVEASKYDYYNYIFAPIGLDKKLFILNDLIPGSRVHSGYIHNLSSITLVGESNITIEGRVFDESTSIDNPSYGAITLFNCSNIIIRNCKFVNITTTKAVSINESQNISMYNCDIIDCWQGVSINQNTGSVRIFSNDFKNIKGHLLGASNCQAAQFSYCSGGDTRIQDNAIENEQGLSAPEDVINVFGSYFPLESPYICRNNWIRGGGPSGSSGGILIGDHGGSNGIIEDNILVNPGQYGVQISGGANHVLRNNLVYGQQLSWSNVGLVVVDWTPEINPNGNLTAEKNKVNWTSRDGVPSDYWVWDDQKWPIGWDTNIWQSEEAHYNMLPEQIIGVEPISEIFEGYWVDKDTGVKSTFNGSADFIEGTVFNTPPWRLQASEIYIPEGIRSINNSAFTGCVDLQIITFPSTIESINSNGLYNTPSVRELRINSTSPPLIEGGSLEVGDIYTSIMIPTTSYDLYKSNSQWSVYKDKLFILNGLLPGSRVHSGYSSILSETEIRYLQNDIIIENIHFDNSKNPDQSGSDWYGLYVLACQNVIIRNCKFTNHAFNQALMIENCEDVVLYNCVFENNKHDIMVSECTGKIRVFSNDVINTQGELIGNPERQGGSVQLRHNTGPGYRVQYNSIENYRDESSPTDVINTFNSYFENYDKLVIRDNYLRGGGPRSNSGGILIGDFGGSNQIMERNILVNPGQYGLSISGGNNMAMNNNLIFGEQLPWSNVGAYAANWTPDHGESFNITIRGNRMRWTNKDGQTGGPWIDVSVQPVEGILDNVWVDPSIDSSILPNKIVGVTIEEIS